MKFRFSQNVTVDDISSVPEDSRIFYVENDGVFSINPDYQVQTEMIDGLRIANEKIRKEHRAATGKSQSNHEALTDKGFDSLDAIFEHIEDLQTQVDSGNKTGKDDFEKRLTANQKAADKRVADVEASYKDQLSKVNSELDKNLITTASQSAFSKYRPKGEPEQRLLEHELRRNAKPVVNENGEREIRLLDSYGEFRLNGQGGYMTMLDRASEMRASKDYGHYFEGEGKRGGGTNPNHSGNAMARPNMGGKDDRSSTEKIKSGLEQQLGKR